MNPTLNFYCTSFALSGCLNYTIFNLIAPDSHPYVMQSLIGTTIVLVVYAIAAVGILAED